MQIFINGINIHSGDIKVHRSMEYLSNIQIIFKDNVNENINDDDLFTYQYGNYLEIIKKQKKTKRDKKEIN